MDTAQVERIAAALQRKIDNFYNDQPVRIEDLVKLCVADTVFMVEDPSLIEKYEAIGT